ncbi:M66 family metalloprotease [Rouxiella badensis]|jgi:hypothetical protein|uniref:M66 family metalloprotease n=1 Tax=Rouxiella badensis TaxID=1646377 RepID=UPI0013EF2F33|nr:M66 family metalloprotease [Rouxiella badensis]MCC3704522.1 M66 family metalloprotease [Rouxiella badensis]QII37663.1 peptidase M66 [Rouxiella badensis]WAT09902.1 M66 family metalloprotease [Rouxiella badensis]
MKLNHLAIAIALASVPVIVFNQAQASINVFLDKNALKNNVEGALSGSVKFAQTHTIDASGNSEQEMPRLTSTRDTLVMFIPQQQNMKRITLRAYDKSGALLGSLVMNDPDRLAKSDRPADSKKPDVVYSDEAWSQRLPADWVQPGLSLEFSADNGRESRLKKIDIGGETQVVLQNIRIGMLTAPGPLKDNALEKESEKMARDYFQKIPVSQLIVGNYSPLHLKEVVLSTGKKYTSQSEDIGSGYDGDMRENIAKGVISMGINNANFGINSSQGERQWQAALFHQVAVHQSWGQYRNGKLQHGFSGGNGMATVYDTDGNEFSHEVGHGYGMGHYPGGGKYATHNQNSGWGWDENQNRFIANFFWDRSGDAVVEGHTTPPFKGIYRFNSDTMGGGVASSPLSRYTLHTGYTQKRIQQSLESTGVITPTSASGYLKWDEKQKKMVEANDLPRRKPSVFGVPVTTLVGFYDPRDELESYIYPALQGSYGYIYRPEPVKAGQCWAEVAYRNGESEKFALEGTRIQSNHMNKFHINVPSSKHPESMIIACPSKNMEEMYTQWKLKKLGVDKIYLWDTNKNEKLGSVYNYEEYQYYFKLKSKPFWYFPTAKVDNRDWTYLTDEKTLKDEYENQLSLLNADYFGQNVLAQSDIHTASVAPMPAATVGHLFAKNAAQAPVAVAGDDFTVTPTKYLSTAYELDASASQNAVSYKWTILKGAGTFWLQEKHAGLWVREVRSAKARALIPANTRGEVTYLLTVTSKEGKTATSQITVSVKENEQVNQDQAFMDSLNLRMTSQDKDSSVFFTGNIDVGTQPTSKPGYVWTLPSGASGANNGKTEQSFSIMKTDRIQTLNVSVQAAAGKVSRTLRHTIIVPAKQENNNIPAWDSAKTYTKSCVKVSYNGKVWLNGWWTRGEKPNNSGEWGVWRQEGSKNMHLSCK